MAGMNKMARSGTKANKGRGPGVKARSQTSTSHTGSHVEPSHTAQQKRDIRDAKNGTAKTGAKRGAVKNGAMKNSAAKNGIAKKR